MKKAALYARVSTTGQTVENQLIELRKYAEFHGYEIYKEYVDQGVSGAKSKRPALDELLEDIQKHRVDVVLVWKLDRLGRSLSHLVQLIEFFKMHNVDLVVTTQNIDTTTPMGKLLFHISSAFAEFERELNIERTMAGLERARKQGKRLGRPPISEETVRKIIQAHEEHPELSIRKLSQLLGIPKSTVHKTLKTYYAENEELGRKDGD